MIKKAKKMLRRLDWFGQAAERNAKTTNLEPGVTAIGMAMEDFQKNRTRAALQERDIPQPAAETQKEQTGKETWKVIKKTCPKCGSDRFFETAMGRKCLAEGCGAVFDLKTVSQLV